MSISVPSGPPHGSTHSASSPTTGLQTPPRASIQHTHSDLGSRQREQGDTHTSLAPRNRLSPSQASASGGPLPLIDYPMLYPPMQSPPSALQRYGEALMSPYMTTPPLHAFLSPPVATRPYVAPSVAGLQRVSFAQMTPEDARAALLAMDISPEFLAAMKDDLNHCTNPYSAGWTADSMQQFVATYGQLVAMPHGLNNATVSDLYRMLASPEPAPPSPLTWAPAEQPQQQTLPFMEMTLEDARAALHAMEVTPQMLARMTEDLLTCVETQGSPAGQECARQFQHEYGHVLAMPSHLDATVLGVLVNLLMDPPEALPQAEPHSAPQPDAPEPQAPGLALHALKPAEARQALLALNVPEPQLLAMAQHLTLLDDALQDEDGDDLVQELAQEFVQNHGHLIALPAEVHPHTLRAMAQMLIRAAPEEN